MKEINQLIELHTNSDEKRIQFKTRYLVEINFTFDLTVRSGSFCGTSHFCVRQDEIIVFCNELSKLYSLLLGGARLNDNDSDSYVELQAEPLGHIIVNGQVGGSHEEHFMKFEFKTDQTSIPHFVEGFKELLSNV